MVKLSQTQRSILEFMEAGHASYLKYYVGPPGAEGKGAGYYWGQYNRTMTPPKLVGSSVNGLIRRGLLKYEEDGDYGITDKGRAAVKENVNG